MRQRKLGLFSFPVIAPASPSRPPSRCCLSLLRLLIFEQVLNSQDEASLVSKDKQTEAIAYVVYLEGNALTVYFLLAM